MSFISTFRWHYILPHQGTSDVRKDIYVQRGQSNLTADGNSANSLALPCDFAICPGGSVRASEAAQWVKAPPTRPEDLGLTQERDCFCMLSSDLHVYTETIYVHAYMDTLQ